VALYGWDARSPTQRLPTLSSECSRKDKGTGIGTSVQGFKMKTAPESTKRKVPPQPEYELRCPKCGKTYKGKMTDSCPNCGPKEEKKK